jgi:hypothetical protein
MVAADYLANQMAARADFGYYTKNLSKSLASTQASKQAGLF